MKQGVLVPQYDTPAPGLLSGCTLTPMRYTDALLRKVEYLTQEDLNFMLYYGVDSTPRSYIEP